MVKYYTTVKVQWSQVVFSTAFIGHHICLLSVFVHVCACVCACVFESVCVCVQRGRSLVCLEWVPSVSWNVALPPMLRWLPSSKMAARITPSQWETENDIFCMRKRGKEALFSFQSSFCLSFWLSSVLPLSLSVDKQCFVGSETGLLLFLLSNLWLSVAARQVLLAGVYVLCYHLQPADKHLL